MTETDTKTWPTARGPYNGNASFQAEIAPPLQRAWEHKITTRYNDGLRVGGEGKLLVPTRGRDVECLALIDGRVLWHKPNSRGFERECYLAGLYGWSKLGGSPDSGFRVSAIEIETGACCLVKAPSFIPQGIYADNSDLIYRQCGGIIDLADVKRVEERPNFAGRIHSNLAYGALDDGTGGSLRYGNDTFSLSCHRPATSDILWTIPLGSRNEHVISAADEVLVSYAFQHEIRVRSTADGHLLWSCQTEEAFDQLILPVISNGLLLRWEGRFLCANELLTGDAVWRYAAFSSRERTNIIATREFIWLGTALAGGKHALLALEKASGRVVWSQKQSAKLGRLALALIDDSLVCLVGSKLVCFK